MQRITSVQKETRHVRKKYDLYRRHRPCDHTAMAPSHLLLNHSVAKPWKTALTASGGAESVTQTESQSPTEAQRGQKIRQEIHLSFF